MSDDMTKTAKWNCLDGLSMEATSRDIPNLMAMASRFAPGTIVAIPYLANESDADRLHAAEVIRDLGFAPMPHVAARHISSRCAFERLVEGWASRARVERLLVLAGDYARPTGPFEDALALLQTSLLPRHGIHTAVISGYPEGHPKISDQCLAGAMHDKLAVIADQGLIAEIATQFCFSASRLLAWLEELRGEGVMAPVRLGIPGPANLRTLLRYAALCGVSASSASLARYGFSLTKLRSHSGPDKLIHALASGLVSPRHGQVVAHFYPFGGLSSLVTWFERQRFEYEPLVKAGLS